VLPWRCPVYSSPISPLLANVFMHYAFDRWMDREHPDSPFARYADLSRHPHKSAYAEVLIMPRMVGTACV
jgi:retron-type reverse transcriptase